MHPPSAPPSSIAPLRLLVVSAPIDAHQEHLFFRAPLDRPAGRAAVRWRRADYDSADALGLDDLDLLILLRPRFPEVPAIVAAAQARRLPFAVLIDDNWLAAGREYARFAPLFAPGRPALETFLAAARAADAVLVHNPVLADDMAAHARRVVRLRPAIDLAAFARAPVPAQRPMVFGYAGSPRWEPAGFQALASFLARRRETRLLLIAHEVPEELRHVDPERLAFVPWQWEYGAYARALGGAAPDVLLAPLDATRFSASKIPFKLFDSAAVGAAGIYSRVPPYTGAVEDGVTGLLVDNTSSAWEAALERLHGDAALRARIAAAALDRVRATASVDVVLPGFLAVLRELANGGAAAVEAVAAPAPRVRAAPAAGPLRVAFLSHQSLVGSERTLVRLFGRLDRARVEPLAVLPHEGPLRGELEDVGVRVHLAALSWWVPATDWPAAQFLAQLEGLDDRVAALADWLAAERVDLVHSNVLVTIEGALAAARLGLPHVWHSRGLFGGGFPPAYLDDVPFLFRAVDALSDAVPCVSAAVGAQAAAFCRDAELPVVHDGIDLEAFLARPVAPRDEVRARHGFDPGDHLLVCLGGLQRRKGQRELVEAVVRLLPRHPRLALALAGHANDAEYVAALDARIAALGIGGRVRRIGFEPEVRSLLAAADALVHPSLSEGFGLAIVEAMACGLPVIATRCGGPEEVIEDGVSGLLVAPGDAGALAAAVDRLLGDPALATALGTAAARRARDFDLDACARSTLAVYDDVLRRHAARDDAGRAARAAAAAAVAAEILSRARRAADAATTPAAPPPPPRTPRRGNWLQRLGARFGRREP